jgi:hypothetical protein
MHDMILGVPHAYGKECTRPDMKRDMGARDIFIGEPREKLGREVKARRGRGDRTGLRGVDRLIIGDIARIRFAPSCDVRRQRRFAFRRNGRIQRRALFVEQYFGLGPIARDDRAFQCHAQQNTVARLQPLGRAHEGAKRGRRNPLMQ